MHIYHGDIGYIVNFVYISVKIAIATSLNSVVSMREHRNRPSLDLALLPLVCLFVHCAPVQVAQGSSHLFSMSPVVSNGDDKAVYRKSRVTTLSRDSEGYQRRACQMSTPLPSLPLGAVTPTKRHGLGEAGRRIERQDALHRDQRDQCHPLPGKYKPNF